MRPIEEEGGRESRQITKEIYGKCYYLGDVGLATGRESRREVKYSPGHHQVWVLPLRRVRA
jgi:hypothetical protein